MFGEDTAKFPEICMCPPDLQLRRSTQKMSQQSHCGIAHVSRGSSEETEVKPIITKVGLGQHVDPATRIITDSHSLKMSRCDI